MSDIQTEKRYDYHGLSVAVKSETKWIYEKDGNIITLEHLKEDQKEHWQIAGFGIIEIEYYQTREDAERKICQLLGVN
jgi:hypothetical protein